MNLKKILWPDTCPLCGKVRAGGLCGLCAEKAEALLVKEPACMKCGKPVRENEQEYCADCMHTEHSYDRGTAVWIHRKPVSTSIYRFKYHNQRFYARFYAAEIISQKRTVIRRWHPDAIVPVPLHPRRKRKRGYNQAEILAREIGRQLEIPVCPELVRRVRDTKPQKNLGHDGRKKNLTQAFETAGKICGLDCILVVDDIYTTGNTIDAVASVLKKAGVSKVYFLTISIGQGY